MLSYDIFISYSRADNITGRVRELIAQIKADHRAFMGGNELKVFFDEEEIKGMDDWRYRILDGIRQSGLLLIFLSPSYLDSEQCTWELNEYLKQEAAKTLLREGVAPVYFVEIPGWEDRNFEKHKAEWIAEIRRRQYFDLRPWFNEGVEALRDKNIKARLDNLNQQIRERLSRMRKALDAPGNLDRHNERFIGRTKELRSLRELIALNKVGIITAIHGLGGIGKTALAIKYAHAFAYDYPGGCWQVRCEGQDDLRVAFISLAGVRGMDFEFTDDEKQNLDLGFERVLRELHIRANLKHPKRVLLIFDNVDQPKLLEPSQINKLPFVDWLHIIVTTRLGEKDLFSGEKDRAFLAIDELPEEEALSLIEEHQPDRHFQNRNEKEAAREIVCLLGGFTLAVESAAIYLEQQEVTCCDFLKRLQKEGLKGLEEASKETTNVMLHSEKRLSATLGPTLDYLNEPENLVLSYSALMPPDHVALPWIRSLISSKFPHLGQDSEPGYSDPWQNLLLKLLSMRILKSTSETNIVRMHRLVQKLVQQRTQESILFLEETLLAHIAKRTKFLVKGWEQYKHQWELSPLAACAWLWLNRSDIIGAYLANQVAVSMDRFGKYIEAKALYGRSLEVNLRINGIKKPNTLTCINNLASLLLRQGQYDEAEYLFRCALEGREAVLGDLQQETLETVNNLAEVLRGKGDLLQAKLLCSRALEGREKILKPDHPDIFNSVREMAILMENLGEYSEAEALFRRALEGRKKVLGQNHPDTLDSMNELAILLENKGDYISAENLFQQVYEICEIQLGPEHQKTITFLNNLANHLRRCGRLDEAESKLRLALDISEKSSYSYSPLIPHMINNLCTVLILQNKLDEAIRLLNRAWEMKSDRHDIISARILFNSIVISSLESKTFDTFISLLKVLLSCFPIPNYGNFTKFWNIKDLLDYVKDKLPNDINAFLNALLHTLNKNKDAAGLDQFDIWKKQPMMPLDTYWPGFEK